MLNKFFVLILMFVCCSACCTVDTKRTSSDDITHLHYYRHDPGGSLYSVEIEGHIYIVVDNHGGSIIHAEHCPCKNN